MLILDSLHTYLPKIIMASHISIMSLHLWTNESTWLKMDPLSKSHGICENFECVSANCNYKNLYIISRETRWNIKQTAPRQCQFSPNSPSEACGIETLSFHIPPYNAQSFLCKLLSMSSSLSLLLLLLMWVCVIFLLALMATGKTFVHPATNPPMWRGKLLDLVPVVLDITVPIWN